MQQFKRHIAAILLAGFLFPQVANSIHYFVIPHRFAAGEDLVFAPTNQDLKLHSCLFHLTGYSALLPTQFKKLTLLNIFNTTLTTYNPELYVTQPNFDFQLRGPPYPQILAIPNKPIEAPKFYKILILKNEKQFNLPIQP